MSTVVQQTLSIFCVSLFLILSNNSFAANKPGDLVKWQKWSDAAFAQAKQENKLVVMDLEAVWCHWCHVMDAETYRKPEIAAYINKHYVALRVDQDEQPHISRRFENYGWPATVFFAADGTEILKRRGYIRPEFMLSILKGVVDDPSPVTNQNRVVVKPNKSAFLTKLQKDKLHSNFEFLYDKELYGWGTVHKFIHSDTLEYAMLRGAEGSKRHELMAKNTLDAARHLIDPVWGGVYQYSDQLDWKSPHYEKIMSTQTNSIRIYAMAYKLWGRQADLDSSLKIYGYLTDIMQSPQGVFYTSQDADLNAEVDGKAYFKLANKQRRALGMPSIDKNIYARENGWIISSILSLYTVTGEQHYLDKAIKNANWIIKNRSFAGDGGFIHSPSDPKSIYLDDTLAMGQAFLNLYATTGSRLWLERASSAANFIKSNFQDSDGGFTTDIASSKSTVLSDVKHIETQIQIARFANLLQHYTGNKEQKKLAEHAMRYLASPDVTEQRRFLSGVLVADREFGKEPVQITVVGNKNDPKTTALFKESLRYPSAYMRVELWDKSEGELPNANVTYPQLDKPAAFACSNNACSLPIFETQKIAEVVNKLTKL